MALSMKTGTSKLSKCLPRVLDKAPEITICFWCTKMLCSAVGDRVFDCINSGLHFDAAGAEVVMGSLLFVALSTQIMMKKNAPVCYWLVVTLSSMVATMIVNNMTNDFGVPLLAATITLSIALLATLVILYATEKSFPVHSIESFRGELVYWQAILLAFAVGTAISDLFLENLNLGYLLSAAGFVTLISVATFAFLVTRLSSNFCFWLVYVLTRSLDATFSGYLTQSPSAGGLGLGVTEADVLLLIAIGLLVLRRCDTRKSGTSIVRATPKIYIV